MHHFATVVIAGQDVSFYPLTISSVAYTSPEAAWGRMTEKEPKERNIDYKKGNFSWGPSGVAEP